MVMPPPTPNQSCIIWFGLTALAVVALVASVGALFWGVGLVLGLLSPVLWPLAIAAVISYLLDPVVDLLARRKVRRPTAIILVFTLAVLLVLGISAAIVPRLILETRELAAKIPVYAAQIQQRTSVWIERAGWQVPFFPPTKETSLPSTNAVSTNALDASAASIPVPKAAEPTTEMAPEAQTWEQKLATTAFAWLPKALPSAGKWLGTQASRVAGWFGLLAGLALVPVYCFYFLLEKKGIERKWTDYLPVQESRVKEELVFVLTAVNDRLIVFFRGQVLVAMCDGALYALGFFLIGLNYSLLIGLFAGMLSIIPFLGAALTLIPALVLAAVQFQDWLHPLLVLLVFGVVQALEGLVISPKIIGDRVGLHPLTIIIAVMVGTTLLGGVLGGILAIPVTAALRVVMFRYVWKQP